MPTIVHEKTVTPIQEGKIELIAGRIIDVKVDTNGSISLLVKKRNQISPILIEGDLIIDASGFTLNINHLDSPLVTS